MSEHFYRSLTVLRRSTTKCATKNIDNNNTTTILYLTTQHPGVIRNSFKHVRETKSIENKRNSLKLPLLKIYLKTCFFKRRLKVEISLAFLTHVGNEFQSFAAKNENDLWRHSRLKLGNVKSVPDPLKL